ncbi:MAG: hypothetical protein U5N53_07415, partial [Mycobacterium sp.]|nr:hypothetical protein [Mycobacterium sp.]
MPGRPAALTDAARYSVSSSVSAARSTGGANAPNPAATWSGVTPKNPFRHRETTRGFDAGEHGRVLVDILLGHSVADVAVVVGGGCDPDAAGGSEQHRPGSTAAQANARGPPP